jgi:hypothetical protein
MRMTQRIFYKICLLAVNTQLKLFFLDNSISIFETKINPLFPSFFLFCLNNQDGFLSVYVYVSLRLSVSLSLHLSVSPSFRLSVSPSLRLSVSPSLHLSISPSLCLSVSLSLHLSTSLSYCLSLSP